VCGFRSRFGFQLGISVGFRSGFNVLHFVKLRVEQPS